MTTRRATFALISMVLMLAGCAGDPATSRLGAGDEAIVVPEGRKDWVYSTGIGKLDAGVRVRIVSDEGREFDVGEWEGDRLVRVRVIDGPERDDVGEVRRSELCPVD